METSPEVSEQGFHLRLDEPIMAASTPIKECWVPGPQKILYRPGGVPTANALRRESPMIGTIIHPNACVAGSLIAIATMLAIHGG